jgi:predicted nuclease of predicted toxin-antitoxin system
MDQIFIQLYLDEDVDVLVARKLEAHGFSVLTTRDAGQLGNTDIEQLEYAAANRKALVTHNRADFEILARDFFNSDREHYGLILASRHSAHEVANRLLTILNNVTADEMKNQVRYI